MPLAKKATARKRATRRTLAAENLKRLEAPRLAELLTECTANDPAAKRRLPLELAPADGAADPHTGWGFDALFLVMAVAASGIFAAVLLLPRVGAAEEPAVSGRY